MLFSLLEDETITAVTAYYTECIKISRTPNGGIEYLAKLETADRESPEDLGTIKVIWNSYEQIDYPIVEVADPSIGLKVRQLLQMIMFMRKYIVMMKSLKLVINGEINLL